MISKKLLACLICEFLALFLIVFLGCGIGLQNAPLLPVVLCVGFLAAALGQALAPISMQINPAVTLALYLMGKMSILESILYIGVQCAASSFGIFAVQMLLPHLAKGEFGLPAINPELNLIQGFTIEFFLTFVLIFLILLITEEQRHKDSPIASLYITLIIIPFVAFAAPLTGACFNPAISFGSAFIFGNWTNHWIYWNAPMTGGIFAVQFYNFIKYLTSDGEKLKTN